jgi:2-alkyl-3-oxoalkanoate reductase
MLNSPHTRTRVLVTGATGFLGRNILEALAKEANVEVIAACRNPAGLPPGFAGEVRQGDLMDATYRASVVQGVDVVCHAGTWSALWGHREKELTHFYQPCIDLVEQSIAAGVGRFLLASTVAISAVNTSGQAIDDFAPAAYTGFWPHLDCLIDVDRYMQAQSHRGTTMVNMRLGHFVGKGNALGLVAALVPRLRTYMVPILGRGRARMALVADEDLAQGFVRAALASKLNAYESFNICGPHFPPIAEVFRYIATRSQSPKPLYYVPYAAAYAFATLMEWIAPWMPHGSPFLPRSLVHVGQDWYCPSNYAHAKIGYVPQKDWKQAVDQALDELRPTGFPWPRLAQA